MPKRLFRVYVDEAGDRGWGGRSSEVFVVSAVIVADDDEKWCRAALDGLNASFGRKPGTVLHWAENVKVHSQRKHVARELARCPATFSNVVVMKQTLLGSGSALSDPAAQYNYAMRRLLERVSWFIDDANGSAILTFAHVRRFPYEKLFDYLTYLRVQPTEIRWAAFQGKPRIEQPERYQMLQAADLVAGCVYAAVRADEFGDHEASYLMWLARRIYRRGSGSITSYGFNVIGKPGWEQAYAWWPNFKALCEGRKIA